MFDQLLNGLKDLFFPKFCVNCKSEGDWLCKKCLFVIKDLVKEKTIIPQNNLSFLSATTTLFDYTESAISKLIKIFKYDSLLEVNNVFEAIISDIKFQITWQDFVVIPVPLHPRRERERGFNQAEILAEIFSKKLALKINKNLQRTIYTAQQAKLSGEQRQTNLNDAFAWKSGVIEIPERVLLIDDVYTTGATMQECAMVLKKNGVKIVCGLALARG